MASSGPLGPGTGTDDSSVGTIAWVSPDLITAQDISYARASVTVGAISHYLVGTNFGFAIPTGATIDGIVAEIRKRQSRTGSYISDYRVRIVKGGAIGATDRADSNYWPNSYAYTTYGTSSDLWGESWSVSDINASNFGVTLSATCITAATDALVEYMRVTVYYTVSTTTIPVFMNQYRQRVL